jgi:hypothetical protein
MILGFLRAFVLALIKLPLALIGLVVVWFALPYRNFYLNTSRPFSQYPNLGDWELVRLPKWALWWDNPYDGMWGDKRGWWANDCKLSGADYQSRFSMWRWAALRNPVNYYSRNVAGVDVSGLVIEQVAGNLEYEGKAPYRGFFLYKGMAKGGKVYPRLYLEFAIYGTYGLMIDIGYKVKLSHNGTAPDALEKDRFKGIVLTISPWKELS